MYDIPYRLLNYDSFHRLLKEILENPQNQFWVQEHQPIGKSICGFPLLHYSIGHGPYEIVYMGGAHGNEIIGVDFILHYMKNLALGNGVFSSFQPDLFRIHFLPLQNPEGFFTTTYAIHEVSKDFNMERFCKDYYLKYRKSNQMIQGVHRIFQAFSLSETASWRRDFWKHYYGKDITINHIQQFLEGKVQKKVDRKNLEDLWNQYIKQAVIQSPWEYQYPFENLDYHCIPRLSFAHEELQKRLKKMFSCYPFPPVMYGNFVANAMGINLNENNESYFEELKELGREEGSVMVSPIYGQFPKNIVGPFGMPSENMDSFVYAPENKAVIEFLKKHQEQIFAFINCHSTGGLLFFNPYDGREEKTESDFSFYINNRIATEYLKSIQKSFLESKVIDTYQGMGYPSRVSGFGDVLRQTYPASFLLELSKAGGNPLGPYIHPNYELTMKVNMDASKSLWKTILEVQNLYGQTYKKYYDFLGRVHYETSVRKRKK
ncbi:MAG: hypothetical protein HFI09_03950 [Bacilli bacterium]|nr:hypothetical protein [Bacilli bacterium]